MADDLRIYALADSQVAYDPDIVLAVDDSGFSNTKKMPVSAIYPKTDTLSAAGDFNPATSTLRLGNGSNVENKVTVDDLLSDNDVVNTLLEELGLLDTGWLDGSKVYAGINDGTFICRVIQNGSNVFFSGIFNSSAAPAIGTILFTLPNEVDTCSEDWYFSGADDSPGNELNSELKVAAGTRNIVTVSASIATGVEQVYGTSYPAI